MNKSLTNNRERKISDLISNIEREKKVNAKRTYIFRSHQSSRKVLSRSRRRSSCVVRYVCCDCLLFKNSSFRFLDVRSPQLVLVQPERSWGHSEKPQIGASGVGCRYRRLEYARNIIGL